MARYKVEYIAICTSNEGTEVRINRDKGRCTLPYTYIPSHNSLKRLEYVLYWRKKSHVRIRLYKRGISLRYSELY